MKLSYVILYVENVEQSVLFYKNAFGLKERFIHESKDYAEMETGSTVLAFCLHKLAETIVGDTYVKASRESRPLGVQITFEPENVTEAYNCALSYGAQSISKPEIKPWNFEVAMVRDCDGHIIELAKKL